MDGFNAKTALETFIRHRGEGTFFPPEWEDQFSIEEAYAVQLALIDHLAEHGMRRIGWKVGLTARPIQDQFGVHEPGFGFLMDDAPHQSGVTIPHETLIGPGFENEICVAMGAPLAGPGVTAADARAAIATIAPSFELVETRGVFVGHLERVIPDNLQQKGIIVGTPMQLCDAPDLSEVALTVTINKKVVDRATGDAVLGDPLNSVVWLANKLAGHGRSLAAGELIMTGSFTKQHMIRKGDTITADFKGIGTVTATFP